MAYKPLFLAILSAAVLAWLPARAEPASGPVVVELFTSQGCNSCPPAEAFLRDLAEDGDVVALEFHVDYWDYIGWKDPFAAEEFTERQRRYAGRLDSRYVYTPQMVIDGRAHEVGSRRSAVMARIEAAEMRRTMADGDDPPKVAVSHADGAALRIILSGRPKKPGRYDVVIAAFDGRHETRVERGENAGKTLVNTHVVRRLETVGHWSGGDAELSVDPAVLEGDGGCAILVQEPNAGPIAAAHLMRF